MKVSFEMGEDMDARGVVHKVPWVRIEMPPERGARGMRCNVIHRVATDEDKARFHREYAAFEESMKPKAPELPALMESPKE